MAYIMCYSINILRYGLYHILLYVMAYITYYYINITPLDRIVQHQMYTFVVIISKL